MTKRDLAMLMELHKFLSPSFIGATFNGVPASSMIIALDHVIKKQMRKTLVPSIARTGLAVSAMIVVIMLCSTFWAVDKSRERTLCYQTLAKCEPPGTFERFIRWTADVASGK